MNIAHKMTCQAPPKVLAQSDDLPDAKDFVLNLVERGELRIGLPLTDQIRYALEELGFVDVRVHHEQWHDFWLIRMNVSPATDCTTERMARRYIRHMAKLVGKRCQPDVLQPIVEHGRIRCAVIFSDARPQELDPIDLDHTVE